MTGVRKTLGLFGWLAASFAAGWIGSRYQPGEWYASLAKPPWNPPNAVFAPVWTTLYVLMAVAAWLVWRRAGFRGAAAGLTLFVTQLVLNALWSYLFFGLHRPDIALIEILVLWGVLLVVTVMFWRAIRLAGVLLLPYLLWTGFASCLNFALWQLNRGSAV